jgi:hypothetical protein
VGSKVCAIYQEKTGLEPPSEVHVCLFCCTHLSIPTIFGTGRRVFRSQRERERARDMQWINAHVFFVCMYISFVVLRTHKHRQIKDHHHHMKYTNMLLALLIESCAYMKHHLTHSKVRIRVCMRWCVVTCAQCSSFITTAPEECCFYKAFETKTREEWFYLSDDRSGTVVVEWGQEEESGPSLLSVEAEDDDAECGEGRSLKGRKWPERSRTRKVLGHPK